MTTTLPDNPRRGLCRERVVEAVIDLVGDEADALAFRGLDQRAQRRRASSWCRSDWRGLPTSTPLSGVRRWASSSMSRRDRPARRRRGFDQHRLAAERLEDVAVRRIARHRDRDAIARLEQRQKGEDESGRRAGGDDHARGIDGNAVGLVVVPRDARAQRRNAERLGVAEPAVSSAARAAVERASTAPTRPAGRPPCGSPGRRRPRCAPPPPSRPSP